MGKLLAQVDIGRVFEVRPDVGIGNAPGYDAPATLISIILKNVYIVAGLLLFVLLIIAGWGILTASGDPKKIGQGQKAFSAALIGFLLIFTSYWIIQIVQKITGVAILNPII